MAAHARTIRPKGESAEIHGNFKAWRYGSLSTTFDSDTLRLGIGRLRKHLGNHKSEKEGFPNYSFSFFLDSLDLLSCKQGKNRFQRVRPPIRYVLLFRPSGVHSYLCHANHCACWSLLSLVCCVHRQFPLLIYQAWLQKSLSPLQG